MFAEESTVVIEAFLLLELEECDSATEATMRGALVVGFLPGVVSVDLVDGGQWSEWRTACRDDCCYWTTGLHVLHSSGLVFAAIQVAATKDVEVPPPT